MIQIRVMSMLFLIFLLLLPFVKILLNEIIEALLHLSTFWSYLSVHNMYIFYLISFDDHLVEVLLILFDKIEGCEHIGLIGIHFVVGRCDVWIGGYERRCSQVGYLLDIIVTLILLLISHYRTCPNILRIRKSRLVSLMGIASSWVSLGGCCPTITFDAQRHEIQIMRWYSSLIDILC